MDLSGISILALDEADEMLDMGFAEDLETILSETPAERQTVFFSATLPPRIAGMVKRHMKEPLRIQIASEPVAKGAAPKVRQTAYIVPRGKKLEVLGRILDLENPASALVFCRTRTEVDNLTERLGAQGYRAQALHGGITQDQRTRVIKRLREGAIDLVIATDVAARGLDIEQLALVVNYDVPATPDSYVHRIGRVGRRGPRGRRDHAGRPARIAPAAAVRAADQGQDRARPGADGRRPARPPAGADPRGPARSDPRRRAGPLPRRGRIAGPGARPDGHRPGRGEAGPSSGRWRQGAGRGGNQADAPREQPRRGPDAKMARIYVGAGRNAGMLPQNLVGAITAEGIKGNLIGAIEIAINIRSWKFQSHCSRTPCGRCETA